MLPLENRRAWGPMSQLKDFQRGSEDHCFHRKLTWRRHGHCDVRSEPGTRGDSPWLFRNPSMQPHGGGQRAKWYRSTGQVIPLDERSTPPKSQMALRKPDLRVA